MQITALLKRAVMSFFFAASAVLCRCESMELLLAAHFHFAKEPA
jgi:hypothetical protein